MKKNSKIYVAGHQGLVGSALMRALAQNPSSLGLRRTSIITRTFAELDLRCQKSVENFFAQEKPEYIFLAAAKVGGIQANIDFPAEFLYDNLLIAANVIHAAYRHKAKKLLFLGSSCIYPRTCPQPIKEEYLLTDVLEQTNEPYAVAKIAGIKLCQAYNKQYGTNFISCMPTNLYGPHDNFDLHCSHVIPALVAKMVQAKQGGASQVTVWGSGAPRREFLFVDDLADALLFLMQAYDGADIVNIGVGEDITIAELACQVKAAVKFEGALHFDTTKPDGTLQKRLDVTKLKHLGWSAQTDLQEGLRRTVAWYRACKGI